MSTLKEDEYEWVERNDDLEFSCVACLSGEEVLVPVVVSGHQTCRRCEQSGFSDEQEVYLVQRKP